MRQKRQPQNHPKENRFADHRDVSDEFDSDTSGDTHTEHDGRRTPGCFGTSSTRMCSSPEPTGNEIAILILGTTGSGKSTFISHLTDDDVTIGHTLESCTAEVEGYTIMSRNGQRIYLIDTPGFDDTQTSEVDLLQKIASALDAMYTNEDIRFAGMLYMHRITDQRVAGSSLKSLRIFEKICGEENFPNVVLVTSMWNLLSSEDDWKMGEKREYTLQNTDEFFGRMVAGGAQVMRDSGDQRSASEIIEHVAQRKSRVVTALQRELADSHKTLGETAVGAFLYAELAEMRKRYEAERQDLLEALEDAKRDYDDDLTSTISEQTREAEKRMEKTIIDERTLLVTKAKLAEFRTKWSSQLREVSQQKETELQKMRTQVFELEEQLNRKEEVFQMMRKSRNEPRSSENLARESAMQKEKAALIEEINWQKSQSDAKAREVKKYRENWTSLALMFRGGWPTLTDTFGPLWDSRKWTKSRAKDYRPAHKEIRAVKHEDGRLGVLSRQSSKYDSVHNRFLPEEVYYPMHPPAIQQNETYPTHHSSVPQMVLTVPPPMIQTVPPPLVRTLPQRSRTLPQSFSQSNVGRTPNADLGLGTSFSRIPRRVPEAQFPKYSRGGT